MRKNLIWKIALILILIVFAGLSVYPPKDRLKPGLDLAGGTSLVYEIDTEGLEPEERRNLAQNMIPILLRRVDPTHVANIVMRPQGNTRIEILLPVASTEAQTKRDAYEKALEFLEKQNVNLMRIKKALGKDSQTREDVFAKFAGDSDDTRQIVDALGSSYDKRKEKHQVRDVLNSQMDSLREIFESAEINVEIIEGMTPQWSKLDEKPLDEAIADFANKITPDSDTLDETKTKLIKDYVAVYGQWAQVVNELTTPETGENAVYDHAENALSEINLSIAQLTDILQMPKNSAQRKQYLDNLAQKFSGRASFIATAVASYDEYSAIGGRLDDPEDLKRMLKGAGVLEFRILPSTDDGKLSSGQIQGYIEALQTKGPKIASDSRYVWCELEDIKEWQGSRAIIGSFGEKFYLLASNQKNEKMLHEDKKWKLKKAYPASDQMGRRAIGFTHDETAAKMFHRLTKGNMNRPLCILLDGLALTAPNIQAAIRSSGIITGTFSQLSVDDMVNKLNAGSFPARLSEVPIAEKSIGSTIGADNRDKGIKAGLIGMAAVAGFMMFYYLRSGVIAVIALAVNLLFVLGMMALFGGTFTLPGIAGLILTIGMSVDANVLIFERIREEKERGSSIRTMIANGYQRAFRTIFDANITTFFVALILYIVASEEIKGFAIVLMLGIISSMFTALFMTRVIFEILIDKRLISDKLKMYKLLKSPQINWMGLRRIFLMISVLIIVAGMGVFFGRNDDTNSKYDIEFTGGTSAQINLKEGTGLDRAQVEDKIREKGREYGNDALAAAKVYSVGDSSLQYEISTTETNKTTASVTFEQVGAQTPESVLGAIEKATEQSAGTLYNLKVNSDDNKTFVVSTSQVNKALVRNILDTTFADKATVSPPEVNEVVNRAIKEAFEGLLAIREDLGLTVLSTEEIDESMVELGDYLGGVKIVVKLDKPVTYSELEGRFKDIRFKPDAQDLVWYGYKLLNTDLGEFEPEETVTEFVYASVHPEAGYRELNTDEWNEIVRNEREKISRAVSLETSLARVTQIDPSIGAQSKIQALIAIVLSLTVVIGYIWIRFGTASYGFAAIVALVHDVCITLGAVTVCTFIADTPIGKMLLIQDFKIDLQMIAAFLTIIGYSLNDTIVVFDRIRENRGKSTVLSARLISNSINQTLSRTLLTSFTTFLVVLVMYIWGGAGLRGFTFAMLVGILAGTYSSIAIAAPILLLGRKEVSLKEVH